MFSDCRVIPTPMTHAFKYFCVDARQCATHLSAVTAYIDDGNHWTLSNRLKLNTDETQFIWLGTAPQTAKINTWKIVLGGIDIRASDKVIYL